MEQIQKEIDGIVAHYGPLIAVAGQGAAVLIIQREVACARVLGRCLHG